MSAITLTGLPGVELSDMLPKLGTQVFSSSTRNRHRREQRLRERDRKVGERGMYAAARRREADAGRRWVHLTPIDDEGTEPLEIFDDPRGPDSWSSADPEFGVRRPLHAVEHTLDPELQWVELKPSEIELIMATNGGMPAGVVWWEDREGREADVELLLSPEDGYCVHGLLVA